MSRAALITGAESGIGLATARLLGARGVRVHLTGLDGKLLRAAATEIGGSASWSVTDVTDAAAVREAVAAAGRLDVLVSNAGISGPIAPLDEYPDDAFEQVWRVHVLGAFHLLKYGLPAVRDGGSVIINSSVVGLTADPGIAGYAAAKHAQVGLMRVAAKECAARGVRVNTVHPGPTGTAFQSAIETRVTGLGPDEARAAFDAMIPLGRHASVEEIARVIAFLAGDESSFITGATIAADGGMSV